MKTNFKRLASMTLVLAMIASMFVFGALNVSAVAKATPTDANGHSVDWDDDAIIANGISATPAVAAVSTTDDVTVTVTLAGNATAKGEHSVNITGVNGVTAKTFDVDVNDAAPTTPLTFTIAIAGATTLTLEHTFTAAGSSTSTSKATGKILYNAELIETTNALSYSTGKNAAAATSDKAKKFPVFSKENSSKDKIGYLDISRLIPRKTEGTFSIALFDEDKKATVIELSGRQDIKTYKTTVKDLGTSVPHNDKPDGTKVIKNTFGLPIDVQIGINGWVRLEKWDSSASSTQAMTDYAIIAVPEDFPSGAAGLVRLAAVESTATSPGKFASVTGKFKVAAQPKAPKITLKNGQFNNKAGIEVYSEEQIPNPALADDPTAKPTIDKGWIVVSDAKVTIAKLAELLKITLTTTEVKRDIRFRTASVGNKGYSAECVVKEVPFKLAADATTIAPSTTPSTASTTAP